MYLQVNIVIYARFALFKIHECKKMNLKNGKNCLKSSFVSIIYRTFTIITNVEKSREYSISRSHTCLLGEVPIGISFILPGIRANLHITLNISCFFLIICSIVIFIQTSKTTNSKYVFVKKFLFFSRQITSLCSNNYMDNSDE